jgi:hypothetical protein
MIKKLILFILLTSLGYNQSILLVGYPGTGFTVTNAPSSNMVWKAIRTQAQASGIIDSFSIFIGDDGNFTSGEVCWAVYESAGIDQVGALKAYGYTASYNFTIVGDMAKHVFPVTTRINDEIISGTWYWYTWYTSRNDGILIARGSVYECIPPTYKKGTSQNQWVGLSVPPPPEYWNTTFGENCYDWGVWGRDTSAVSIRETFETPKQYELFQNYPNPFNPSTKIKYDLPKAGKIKIEIFNLLGQKVATLLNEQMPLGSHEVEFTAKDLPSGVYLYRIVVDSYGEVGNYVETKKMLLLR